MRHLRRLKQVALWSLDNIDMFALLLFFVVFLIMISAFAYDGTRVRPGERSELCKLERLDCLQRSIPAADREEAYWFCMDMKTGACLPTKRFPDNKP